MQNEPIMQLYYYHVANIHFSKKLFSNSFCKYLVKKEIEMFVRTMFLVLIVVGVLATTGECVFAQEKPGAEVAKEQITIATSDNVKHLQVTWNGRSLEVETEELMVVYRALYGEGGLWVRPAVMGDEIVERDGRRLPRFRYIGDET